MKRWFKNLWLGLRIWFDRQISGSSLRQILMVFVAALVIFMLLWGFVRLFLDGSLIGHHIENINSPEGTKPQTPNTIWQLYYFFVDAGNQMCVSVENNSHSSRWVALIMSTIGSIFLGGLLISTITNTIQRRVDQYRNGMAYYKFRDHVVIIGSDLMLHGIITQLIDDKSVKSIVVMTTHNIEETRTDIMSGLKNKKDRKRVMVNYGKRDSEHYLRKARVTEAREVYILGDSSEFDEIESYHDSLNVECLAKIAKLCAEKGRKGLPCNVSFDYKTTYHVFQYADLPKSITDYIDVHPFNFYDFWAQNVFVTNSSPDDSIKYKPLDYEPITSADSDKYVHLIIIGFSQMGQAMALEAAHISHYPNYKRHKTRITIIDRNMRHEMDEFKQKCGELFEVSRSTFIDADEWATTGSRSESVYGINRKEYGHLVTDAADPDFIDIDWTFIKGDDANPRVRELLEEYIDDKNAVITVAVCLNITHRSLRSAMRLPKKYYEKDIPVLVQQRKTSSLADTLSGAYMPAEVRESMLYKNLKPFGMVNDCYDIRHAMTTQYCKRINYVYSSDSEIIDHIDDAEAEKLWHDVRITKRWSNIYSAASIPTKLRCLGYDLDRLRDGGMKIGPLTEEQIEIIAQTEHNRWNVEELLLGYRPVSATEEKDIEADVNLKNAYRLRRIHYDIRPYDDLRPDAKGRKANEYDKKIVRNLPAIVKTRNRG